MNELALSTASAHWGWDEHCYFGQRVFGELAGRESLTGLTALSVLGRRLSAEQCAVIDDAAVCLTLADPRIWPLKLTRVIAAHGGMAAGAAAGLLIQEHARIGAWTAAKAAELLVEFQLEFVAVGFDGEAMEAAVRAYLAKHQFVWGFGTPFRKRDERLIAFSACLERRGRRRLPFMRTLDAISAVVVPARQTEPNMAMALAAAFLDLGLNVHEVGPLSAALMQHMFFAHAVEGARQAPPVLQCLPERCVDYVGRAARTSPRAQHAANEDATDRAAE